MSKLKNLILGVMIGVVISIGSTPAFANFCPHGDAGLMTDTTSTPDSTGGVTLNKTLTLLNGVDQIKGAAYDPVKGEIVFIGEGTIPLNEQIDLDDLIVAIRTIYNVAATGLSADPGITFTLASDRESTAQDNVLYFGQTQNTQFGQILFDADYLLKTLGQGVDKDGVMVSTYAVPSAVANMACPTVSNPTFASCFGYQSAAARWIVNSNLDFTGVGGVKFWFEPKNIELDAYKEGELDANERSFKFTNVTMRVTAEVLKTDGFPASRAEFPSIYAEADAFARTITTYYDDIAVISGFEPLQKLKRLAKVVAVTRWLRDNYIPVDLSFMTDYVPKTVTTPTKVNLLQLCGSAAGQLDAANSGPFTSGQSCGVKIVGGVDYNLANSYTGTVLDPLISSAVSSPTRIVNAQTKNDMAWDFSHDGTVYQGIAQTVSASEKEGNIARSSVDLAFPNRSGQPLAMTRYYDSFSGIASGFGPGWSALPFSLSFPESYDLICPAQTSCALGERDVVVAPVKVVLIDRLTGRTIPFSYAGIITTPAGESSNTDQYSPYYVSPRTNDWIYLDTTGYFIYEQRNATNQVTKQVWFKSRVDTNGVKVLADPHYVVVHGSGGDSNNDGKPDGVWLQYSYDSQNRLSKIADLVGGQGIKLGYTENRIFRVWYAATEGTREVNYGYNNGRLETTNRNGHIIKYTYADLNDTTSGVVAEIKDLSRNETLSSINSDLENRATHSQAEDNNVLAVTYQYNRATGLTTHTDSLGREVQIQRDAGQRLQSVTTLAKVEGVPTTLGSSRVYEDSNPLAGPTTVTDTRGNASRYAYDAAGNVTRVTDALNRITTIERGIEPVDGNAAVTVVTDPKGRVSLRKYDDNGRLVARHRRVEVSNKTTNANGIIEFTLNYASGAGYSQTIAYDALTGVAGSVTNDAAQLASLYPWLTANETTQYSNFNNFGQATTVRSAAGYATQMTYDTLARPRSVQGPADVVPVSTNYAESGLSQDSVSTVTTALGSTSQTVDVINRKRSVTDTRGITTHYINNKKDQLERVVEIPLEGSTILTTQYFYDDFGQLKNKQLPNGSLVEYRYDGFDRLIEIREVEGSSSTNVAPILVAAPPAANVVDVTTGFSFDLNAVDVDSTNVTYQLLLGPDGMIVDSVTGMITWGSNSIQIGNYNVIVQVLDGDGGVSNVTFEIIVVTDYDYDGDGVPDPDIDNDGFPDPLELQYFGDLSHNNLSDSDSDNFTDFNEIKNKTNYLVHNLSGRITQNIWNLSSVSNQDIVNNGFAANAFDSDITTLWQTEANAVSPHSIDIDLGNIFDVVGFTYLPPSDEGTTNALDGVVVNYEFYVSTDGLTWTQAVEGVFAADFTEKKVMFSPQRVRYVRFVSLSDANNSGLTRVAELNVLAPAKIYRVNKTEDTTDGSCDAVDCSLREAVIAANARRGLDMIQLPGGTTPYELTVIGREENGALTGDFDITDDLIVHGSGTQFSEIDAATHDRIFHVAKGVSVVIANLMLSNGYAGNNSNKDKHGGAFFNEGGTVVIADSLLIDNVADGYGGAIENRSYDGVTTATMVLRRSELSSNCAFSGGAIENGGSLTISDSIIADNQPVGTPENYSCRSSDGGGIHIQYGDVLIENSSIYGNIGADGAISNWGGTLTMNNSTLAGNSAFPFSNDLKHAGGITAWAGTVSITNSTITDNQGTYGGGILSYGVQVSLWNSTLVGNRATFQGGGIFSYSNNGPGVITIQNTIIAMNTASVSGPDCFTDNTYLSSPGFGLRSLGGNIISDLGSTDVNTGLRACNVMLQASDREEITPVVDLFTDNGTPGNGHYPLLANSIAIDAANNANCPDRDQLGTRRPQNGDSDLNPLCDIGAIEYLYIPQQCATENDIDCDGLPDTWEVQYFGDLSRNGSRDFDGDGMNDYQEYLDGSDPVAPAVPPVATIDTPSNSVIIITGESLVFSGSGIDPDGDDSQLSYAWDFGGTGALPLTGTSMSPDSIQFTATGTYIVELVVTDESGLSSSPFTVNVTVTAQAVNNHILNIRINSASDDAEENNNSGSMYLTSSDLELVRDTADQAVGMRFTEIDIPQGATINTAYVQFTVDEVSSIATNLLISGEATHDATPFNSTTYNISTRTETTARVAWVPPAWNTVGTAGTNQRTPELSSIIQEIVDQTGWNRGQALALLINGTGKRVAESYNGSRTEAPLLHVEYTVPDGGTNRAPVATGGRLITNENTVATGTLVASDADRDTLGYRIDSPPTQGRVIIDDVLTGDYTYTPNIGVTGTDSFTFKANDGTVDSNTATITVTINIASGASGTVNVRIASGADDAEEHIDGNIELASSDLELVYDRYPGMAAGNQQIGLRFTAVAIPQGAMIDTAYLQFKVDEKTTVTTNLTVTGQATDNAPAFNTTAYDISSRAATTSNINWRPATWSTVGVAGAEQRTPELKAVIQEIVDRSGWMNGNALALMITGTGERVAESYDGDIAGAALLHVEYTIAGGDTIINTAPISSDDSLTTYENAVATGTLVASDVDGDTLGYRIDSPPTQGRVIIDDVLTGDYTYTPNIGVTGTDSFTFTANDGTVDSNTATVTVTINAASGASGTVNVRIASGADDAEEHIDGNMELASSDLELVYDRYPGMAAGNQQIGLRFTGIAIPQGAMIDKAYLQFKVDEKTTVTTSLTITGQATDNASAFSTITYDISSRAATTSSTTWMPARWSTVGVAGVDQRTPELKAVIQEIVDRSGWVNGNALALMITGTGERVAESYDGDIAGAALLHVEYTVWP